MGYDDLVKGLNSQAEERVQKLWSDVRAQAEAIRTEAERQLHIVQQDSERIAREEGAREARRILSRARRYSGLIRLQMEEYLSERLYQIASEALKEMRGNGSYAAAFATLADEIPDVQWKTIRVHPSDVALAGELFPESTIEPDEWVMGGIIAESANGLTVTNTFSKRLERMWRDILPDMVEEVLHEAEADADSG